MDLNQISSNKAILNIGTPGDTGLTLNKGEVLKGVVQSIREDGLVMLSLKGSDLKSKVKSSGFQKSAAPADKKEKLKQLAISVSDLDDILMIVQ